MLFDYIVNTQKIVKFFAESVIKKGDYVIDATIGNGHDICLLAKLVGDSGKAYGFDIQDSAITNTQKKIENENLYNRVVLIKDSHEKMDNYIRYNSVSFIIFNLGYLPGSDHTIITNSSSTVKAIEVSLKLLKNNGVLMITSYVGHKGGKEENRAIEKLLASLNQKEYNVLKFDFINQVNNPPILYGVEKHINN